MWIVLLLATVAGLGVLAWFFVALPIQGPRPDEFAEIDRLAGEKAGVPEAMRDRPNAAQQRLDRALAAVVRAHETALGRVVRTEDGFNWGQVFPDRVLADQASRDEARRVIAAMEAEGVWRDLDELAKDPRVFAPIPRRSVLVSTVESSLPELRQWARVHTGASRLALEEGRAREAILGVERNLLLAKVASFRPGLLASMVSQALATMAYSDAVSIAMSGKASAADLEALAVALQSPSDLDLEYAMGVERQWVLRTIGEMLDSTPIVPINRGAQQSKIDQVHEWYRSVLAEPEGPVRQQRLREVESRVSSLSIRYRVAQMNTDGLGRVLEVASTAAAKRDLARVMVAAARFRAETGSLPASLNDLVPKYLDAAPMDPYSGRELRFRVDPGVPGGLLVWSVGPDGDDDQGRAPRKGMPTPASERADGDVLLEWDAGWDGDVPSPESR
jgi:hypothetical protein